YGVKPDAQFVFQGAGGTGQEGKDADAAGQGIGLGKDAVGHGGQVVAPGGGVIAHGHDEFFAISLQAQQLLVDVFRTDNAPTRAVDAEHDRFDFVLPPQVHEQFDVPAVIDDAVFIAVADDLPFRIDHG